MSLPAPSDRSVALVTGASSGIGREFARALSGRGHRVAIVARRAERLEQLRDELGGPERAMPIAADLAEPADRDRIAATLAEQGLDVEILVNNAGLGVYGEFVRGELSRELQQVRVDVEAVVDLVGRFLPAMIDRGRGAIINMASTAAFQPLPYNAGYAAAKAHVLAFSEGLAEEVRSHGVTVTAVCPGPVATEFQEVNDAGGFAKRLPKTSWVPPEKVAAYALEAADRGRRSMIPGGPHVKASFWPSRVLPAALSLKVTKRMFKTS